MHEVHDYIKIWDEHIKDHMEHYAKHDHKPCPIKLHKISECAEDVMLICDALERMEKMLRHHHDHDDHLPGHPHPPMPRKV